MGLKSDITQSIAEAFATDLKDAVKPFTGKRVVHNEGSYDILTNSYTDASDTTITYSGKGVFAGYTSYEVDNETILASDQKLICLQSNLKPQLDDVINDVYQVVRVKQDPASVVWILQLRRS